MNQYYKKILFGIILSSLLIIFSPVFVSAQTANPTTPTTNPATVSLSNPLGTTNVNPSTIIGKVINAVLGLVGSLALAMFIYGGFMWMIAAGSPERVQKGKDIILWATIGLIVIFSSYALVKFVLDTLAKT